MPLVQHLKTWTTVSEIYWGAERHRQKQDLLFGVMVDLQVDMLHCTF